MIRFLVISITLVFGLSPFSFLAQLTSTNLPIIKLTVSETIEDEPAISGSMKIIYDSLGGANSATDLANIFNGPISIEARGNSSLGFEKKSYTIRLSGTEVPLLGMPADSTWILHAMHIDKSLMRIPMSFYFSERMGHYVTRNHYVEVILNGEYIGLYLFCEKILRSPDRVEAGNGYILRIDWGDGSGGFDSNYESMGGVDMTFQYYDPKGSTVDMVYKENMKSYIHSFEELLFTQNAGYRNYIDMESFVDFLLINELSKNSDGYKLSTYIHKPDSGKLTAGPIWDFDQTYGLSMVCSNYDHCGWTYLQNQDGCEDLGTMPRWWEQLTKDSVFCNLLVSRWENFRTTFLQTDSINTWIDSNLALMNDAATRNFVQWPILGTDIWDEPLPVQPDYPSEITYMKDWIQKRVLWMDSNIGNIYDFSSFGGVKIYPNPSADVANIVIQPGGTVKVADLTGRIIWSSASGCADTAFTIDVSGWAIGCYVVYVKTTRGVYSSKLVVR
ncbi:MAG: CotH kinase family protein [Flavobacteriales bacterium]|nr:CotH kinase family protein [Flavobacteriales bacterium]